MAEARTRAGEAIAGVVGVGVVGVEDVVGGVGVVGVEDVVGVVGVEDVVGVATGGAVVVVPPASAGLSQGPPTKPPVDNKAVANAATTRCPFTRRS